MSRVAERFVKGPRPRQVGDRQVDKYHSGHCSSPLVCRQDADAVAALVIVTAIART